MIVTEERYLAHYGVLGMKWGKRKAARYEKTASKIEERIGKKKSKEGILNIRDGMQLTKSAHLRSKAKDLKSNKKVSLRESNKNAKTARIKATKEAKEYNKLTKSKKELDKKAKKDRKQKMKSAYKEINKTSNFLEKVVYNSATRKKAAQYVVDNNMSISDAKKKANQLAVKNTTTLLATIGAATLISKRIGR